VAGRAAGRRERLAAGASGDARWLRLADAATGEPTEGGYIAGGLYDVVVPDRGEALVLTGGEVALIG
jgi:hypothetical protein